MCERADEKAPVAKAVPENPLDGVERVINYAVHARKCKALATGGDSAAPRARIHVVSVMASDARGEGVDSGEVTALLRAWSRGDPEAPDRLLPLVYGHLHRLAASQMRKERANHTLQPTALVHEAYVKLVDQNLSWKDRGHFYGVAARAMREVLVDHARRRERRQARARAGSAFRSRSPTSPYSRARSISSRSTRPWETSPLSTSGRPGSSSSASSAGLTVQEAADVLGCSAATASRDYRHAEVWLRRQMRGASA